MTTQIRALWKELSHVNEQSVLGGDELRSYSLPRSSGHLSG